MAEIFERLQNSYHNYVNSLVVKTIPSPKAWEGKG